jgi:hypothetical protein
MHQERIAAFQQNPEPDAADPSPESAQMLPVALAKKYLDIKASGLH